MQHRKCFVKRQTKCSQCSFIFISLSTEVCISFMMGSIKYLQSFQVMFYWEAALKELLCGSFYYAFIARGSKQRRKRKTLRICRSFLTLSDVAVSPAREDVIMLLIYGENVCSFCGGISFSEYYCTMYYDKIGILNKLSKHKHKYYIYNKIVLCHCFKWIILLHESIFLTATRGCGWGWDLRGQVNTCRM